MEHIIDQRVHKNPTQPDEVVLTIVTEDDTTLIAYDDTSPRRPLRTAYVFHLRQDRAQQLVDYIMRALA